MGDAMAKPTSISWRRSDRMVAAYLQQIGGYVALAAAAVQPFAAELPRWLQIVAAVVLGVAGAAGIKSGRSSVARRIACGADPARSEAPIHRGPEAAPKEVKS